MLRIGGLHTSLPMPQFHAPRGGCDDFGISGTKLFVLLDQLCRKLCRDTLVSSKGKAYISKRLDELLDPARTSEPCVYRSGSCVATSYLPKEYISSSILDSFYYSRLWNCESHHEGLKSTSNNYQCTWNQNHFSNHASHTDSGLLTAVICTNMPALEVFDQKLHSWIAVEKLIHQKEADNRESYAIVFWGDSCTYLAAGKDGNPTPCLHRVVKTPGARFSVVYKQRTRASKSAPRYQGYKYIEINI